MADKWGRRLFAGGASVMVLLGIVHILSLFAMPVPANDSEKQLADLMSNYRFDMMGSMRTMNELLRGFSISFLVAAIVMGSLSLALRHERPALLKKLALINTIWLAVLTTISVRYFFAAPTSFLMAGLVAYGAAWVMLPSGSLKPALDTP
jgi:hypothetical protein